MQDPSKELGEVNHKTLGQTRNVLLTNPDPSCCDSLVIREGTKSAALSFQCGSPNASLHQSTICLRICGGFAVVQAEETTILFFKQSLKLK